MMVSALKKYFDLEDPELISIIDDLPLWSAPFGFKLMDIVQYKKKYSCTGYWFWSRISSPRNSNAARTFFPSDRHRSMEARA